MNTEAKTIQSAQAIATRAAQYRKEMLARGVPAIELGSAACVTAVTRGASAAAPAASAAPAPAPTRGAAFAGFDRNTDEAGKLAVKIADRLAKWLDMDNPAPVKEEIDQLFRDVAAYVERTTGKRLKIGAAAGSGSRLGGALFAAGVGGMIHLNGGTAKLAPKR